MLVTYELQFSIIMMPYRLLCMDGKFYYLSRIISLLCKVVRYDQSHMERESRCNR